MLPRHDQIDLLSSSVFQGVSLTITMSWPDPPKDKAIRQRLQHTELLDAWMNFQWRTSKHDLRAASEYPHNAAPPYLFSALSKSYNGSRPSPSVCMCSWFLTLPPTVTFSPAFNHIFASLATRLAPTCFQQLLNPVSSSHLDFHHKPSSSLQSVHKLLTWVCKTTV